MKTRTLMVLIAGAALLSTTAMADGFRFGASYHRGFNGGFYGGGGAFVGGGGFYGGGAFYGGGGCGAPVVYSRGYAPYYAPSRTVIYNTPRYYPAYRPGPRYRSSYYYGARRGFYGGGSRVIIRR